MTPLRITWAGRPTRTGTGTGNRSPGAEQGSYRCSRATSSAALDVPGQPSGKYPRIRMKGFVLLESKDRARVLRPQRWRACTAAKC
jgi:hypothetical protein